MAILTACLLATVGSDRAAHIKLTWGSAVTETAPGCDAFTPARAMDGTIVPALATARA